MLSLSLHIPGNLLGRRLDGRAVIRNQSGQSRSIQCVTLRYFRRIFQIAGISLHEAFRVVGNAPIRHSANIALIGRSASGNRNRTSGALNNVGSNGNYWVGAPNSQTNARNLNFNSGNVNPLNNNNRANGFAVRPSRVLMKIIRGYVL